MFQHSFTFLVLGACLKFMPVCVDLLFDFRFGSVRFIFLPGRCVRKRTIGHQLVNEEGKVDGETPPPFLFSLHLLPAAPTLFCPSRHAFNNFTCCKRDVTAANCNRRFNRNPRLQHLPLRKTLQYFPSFFYDLESFSQLSGAAMGPFLSFRFA